jgi:type IV pilus assembly protein PilM
MVNIIVTGIDFSYRTLSAVTLEMTPKSPVILRAHQFDLSGDIFTDNTEENYQEIVNKCLKVKKTQPLFQHRVALMIPESAVMTKVVDVDKRLPQQQQYLSANHHFTNHSPLPLNELVLTHVEHEVGIQIYAAKRTVLDRRCQIIKKAGMTPILVDTEKQAFLQLLVCTQGLFPLEQRLLVEITPFAFTIGFLNQTQQFYRQFPISDAFVHGSDITTISDQVVQEIDRLRTVNEGMNWNGIWLIAQMDHYDLFASNLEMAGHCVEPYPLFSAFIVKRSQVTQKSLMSAKACGIALRGINAVACHYAA